MRLSVYAFAVVGLGLACTPDTASAQNPFFNLFGYSQPAMTTPANYCPNGVCAARQPAVNTQCRNGVCPLQNNTVRYAPTTIPQNNYYTPAVGTTPYFAPNGNYSSYNAPLVNNNNCYPDAYGRCTNPQHFHVGQSVTGIYNTPYSTNNSCRPDAYGRCTNPQHFHSGQNVTGNYSAGSSLPQGYASPYRDRDRDVIPVQFTPDVYPSGSTIPANNNYYLGQIR